MRKRTQSPYHNMGASRVIVCVLYMNQNINSRLYDCEKENNFCTRQKLLPEKEIRVWESGRFPSFHLCMQRKKDLDVDKQYLGG